MFEAKSQRLLRVLWRPLPSLLCGCGVELIGGKGHGVFGRDLEDIWNLLGSMGGYWGMVGPCLGHVWDVFGTCLGRASEFQERNYTFEKFQTKETGMHLYTYIHTYIHNIVIIFFFLLK